RHARGLRRPRRGGGAPGPRRKTGTARRERYPRRAGARRHDQPAPRREPRPLRGGPAGGGAKRPAHQQPAAVAGAGRQAGRDPMRFPAFLRRSVRRKVTALVVATTAAALLVTALLLVSYNVRDYRRTKVTEMKTQAEILGRASAPALAFGDRKEAARDLAMLEARPDVERAALYSPDGALFAAWARGGDVSAVPATVEDPGTRIEGDRLRLVYPIVDDDQRLGTVVLLARYGLRDRLMAYVVILAAVMAGALIA